MNVREPVTPKVIGTFTALPDRPRALAVSGSIAYVPAGAAGLLMFDISDPAQLLLVSKLSGLFSSDITLAGNVAYVVERLGGENYFT